MDLELQKERFDCYRCAAPFVSTQEETAETIVPDYSPDIARIVDVSACLLLRGQTAADGRLTATGSVRLTLLYMAEGAQGLRSLEYSIPFEHSEELPAGCDRASVEGRVCSSEARLLNPRKLFTRLDIEWKTTPYRRTVFTACGSIADADDYAIETLSEKHEVSLIQAVNDKDFVFSEEMTIPGGREAIGELLSSRVKLRVSEAKSIGSKVILKGVACVSLIYAAENGSLCSYAEELPFSQILDGVSQDEGGESGVSAVLNLSGCEIHTSGESGEDRTVSVKLSLNAFVVLRRAETVGCITDLYSTSHELDAEMETLELWQEPETLNLLQSVREQLDTGTDVGNVVCADVCFGSVGVRQNGDRTSAWATATVSALYQDESGVPFAVRRRIEITADGSASEGAQASVANVCAGDITANVNANGIELRFPAEFTVTSASALECPCLTSLSVNDEKSAEAEAGPALVLRALQNGETLWDVAKQYRTTVEEILSANELTGGVVPEVGRMLLIPRKR